MLIFTLLLFGRVSFAEEKKYALIVGISGYPHFGESEQLRFADKDAQLFYDFILTDNAGRFSPQNVKLLLNAQANRENIYDAVRWLGKRVESEDRVYIFFAGHGVVDDLGIAYFMPYGSDPSNPVGLGIRTSSFIEELRLRITARQLVVFVDACHSGSVYSEGLARDSVSNIARPFNNAWEDVSKKYRDTISMAFLSASSNQRSYEDPGLGHGVFTYYLVEGLSGNADQTQSGDKDGVVTAGELYRYVLDKVEYHTKEKLKGKEQSPCKSPQFAPLLPLAIIARPEKALRDQTNIAKEALNDQATLAWKHAVAGYKALKNGNEDQALAHYRKAIEIDPRFSEAYVSIGYIYMGRFNIQGAVWYFQKALEFDPNNYIAHNNLGFCYQILMNFPKAISHLQKSYSTFPTLLTALNLGDSYRHSGEFSSALNWHQRAREVLNDPGIKDYLKLDYMASSETGWIYNYMPLAPGDTETINYYVRVKTPEEKMAFLYYALSFDYALTKDFLLADKEFERAIGLKQPDEFGLFFVNRIQYIQKLPAVDQKTNAWFDKQKRRLLSR